MMNPNDCETYNFLGHILWKKRKLKDSKECLEEGIKKKKSKKGLRYLSIILRSIEADSFEERASNIKRSLQLAKDCLMLDLKDGESWCNS